MGRQLASRGEWGIRLGKGWTQAEGEFRTIFFIFSANQTEKGGMGLNGSPRSKGYVMCSSEKINFLATL